MGRGDRVAPERDCPAVQRELVRFDGNAVGVLVAIGDGVGALELRRIACQCAVGESRLSADVELELRGADHRHRCAERCRHLDDVADGVGVVVGVGGKRERDRCRRRVVVEDGELGRVDGERCHVHGAGQRDGLGALLGAVVLGGEGDGGGAASLSTGDGERRDGPRGVVGGHGRGVVVASERQGHGEVVGQRVRVELRGHGERGLAGVLGDLGGLDGEIDGCRRGFGEDFEGEVVGFGQPVAVVVSVEQLRRGRIWRCR